MDRETLLANIPLFESLTPEDLTALATRLHERSFDEGAVVFSQGEDGTALYLVQEGAVDISVSQGKANISVALLSTGKYFGELSLLDGGVRSATATTTKPTVLLELSRDDFVDYVKSRPPVALSILAEMGERMRNTNAIMAEQVSRNVLEEEEEKLTFGQRIADHVASFGGSWMFIGLFLGFMGLWMGLNLLLDTHAWDPMPYVLLNLMLSTIAALQGPVIMMSQNRQSVKDKLLAENDFHVNLKNEINIAKLLKIQVEILQRLAMVERQSATKSMPGIQSS